MAITAQAFSMKPGTGGGSTSSTLTPAGQYAWGPGDVQQPFAVGTVTFTGDGATTAAVVNWIDGTQTLAFIPSAVFVFISGGNDVAGVLRAAGGTVSSLTATSFTVNYSTAIANTATSTLTIVVYR